MSYVLGLDNSTQSLSAVLLHVEDTPEIVDSWQIRFGDMPCACGPSGYIENMPEQQVHADPLMWLETLDALLAQMKIDSAPLSEVVALSGSGQQHGSVYLTQEWMQALAQLSQADSLAAAVAPCLSRKTSPIWMDNSTAQDCQAIAEAVGGHEKVYAISGSMATERFTGPQICRFARLESAAYAATERIHLVSSFLCSILAGQDAPIDTGDGAGMNLLDLHCLDWSQDLLDATAEGLREKLPPVVASSEIVGTISPYFERYGFSSSCRVMAFSGDNPCALVGMGAAEPGQVVVSLGTSDTLFAANEEFVPSEAMLGHVFGNPLDGFMNLMCFRNGSLAREAFRDQLQVDWDVFEQAAEVTLPEGVRTRPFIWDEITPILPAGLEESHPDLSPAQRVRAFVMSQAQHMKAQANQMGIAPRALRLTGGATQNTGIVSIFSEVFGVPVEVGDVDNAPALGAALRAIKCL